MDCIKLTFFNFCLKLKIKKFIYLTYSGGLDSSVLFYIFYHTYHSTLYYKIIVVHVNHYINNDISSFWEYYCKYLCFVFNVSLFFVQLKNSIQLEFVSLNLENFFRLLRFFIFEIVGSKFLGIFFFGHHLNDQIETFFYSLMRNNSLLSLSIKNILYSLYVIRPFIHISRRIIIRFVKYIKITWVQDKSNFFFSLSRNFFRHKISSLLCITYPFFSYSIEKFIFFFYHYCKFFRNFCENIVLFLCDNVHLRINLEKFLLISYFLKKYVLLYWFLKNDLFYLTNKQILYINLTCVYRYKYLFLNTCVVFCFKNYMYILKM